MQKRLLGRVPDTRVNILVFLPTGRITSHPSLSSVPEEVSCGTVAFADGETESQSMLETNLGAHSVV